MSSPKSLSMVMRVLFSETARSGVPCLRVRAKFSRVQGVVSLALKPLCQPASCAAVHEEVHFYPTDTCARESPAMTAWA